jgi:hypothetical protein
MEKAIQSRFGVQIVPGGEHFSSAFATLRAIDREPRALTHEIGDHL